MPNDILIATQLWKDFDGLEVVRNASLQLPAGRTVALLGPSGSGKSTLLSLLAGLERPSRGEVFLDGQALSPLSEDELCLLRRHKVGFVFQAFYLIPTLSALENVAFPLYPTGVPKRERQARALELLSQVGLAARREHLPAKLSGGERQRVAIARALVNRPRVLFCDEPTGNLDSQTGGEILDLLFELNLEQSMALLMVTHDRGLAARADETWHMHDGEVSQ
ncbi:ABC transporter ATP-binding protein [Desulfoferula mesophila]|uniref:ABC transporter ATP-binding protein n=1 Tax=Desulfoferula mesophila TaxID=3058419 RepID=A0AAU9EY89_9BACT|nr:ABC transporter ATP-binding protein [Desulfoferula mesophilus]